MAEPGRNNQETGIPYGLNRIKTRGGSKEKLSSEVPESRRVAASRPVHKDKQKTGPGKSTDSFSSREEVHKGKKLARWFSSYISRFNNVSSNAEDSVSEIKNMVAEEPSRTRLRHGGILLNGKQTLPERGTYGKGSKGLKSFSHELGPKGGMSSAHTRAHSFNDLKELLATLHLRFDAAKEVVNAELAVFARDVMNVLGKMDSSSSEALQLMEDLLILAQQCIEMSSTDFRAKCELIVQDLTEKRQQCQTGGLVKWFFTRVLFILTRCTRLLMFQKEREPIDESSLHKFKKCLDSIPAVETSWAHNHGVSDSDSEYDLRHDAGHKFAGQTSSIPEDRLKSSESANQSGIASNKNVIIIEEKLQLQENQINSCSEEQQVNQVAGRISRKLANSSSCLSSHEQEHYNDGNDSAICRICEEIVPISHLESHSYICAYADKCELNCLDLDERLLKLSEILEQIAESCNLSFQPPVGSPENSKVQTTSSAINSEGCSPKLSECRSKSLEGMFEDIHEMDTACIDDSHLNAIHIKSRFGVMLSSHPASSSAGSMTSVSSTNTPRAGHFDSFWVERNNASELEDVQQMIELADIARCVADADQTKEASCEFLLACLQDLQDVLQHSELQALVIDTFGSRIEKLLREKYILACESLEVNSPLSFSKHKENSRFLLDTASPSSSVSTPISQHRERTSIDDFEIIKPISRGAFGKVFLARKRTTGDLFAIKVLQKLDMIRKNDIERILAERNILITVRNPFVVRFFYSFSCRDNLYLVMEYLNGGDLYSLLRKIGCLEEEVARIYIAELVLALEYLHSLGIVHRDLKPDNILIAHDGHIKLTDFGLSKIGLINNTMDLSVSEGTGAMLAGTHNPGDQQTKDRSRYSAVGTPDYLAPEILLGTEHGYAADWWSVGIILFEFITGIPPFSAECPEMIFDNILNKKIPWPHVPNEMSAEAQDLINRFLIHEPNQRLGANGAAEVKNHPFFNGVNWNSLAEQKAAFVPQPESIDDTSYFLSRFSHFSTRIQDYRNSNDSDIDSRSSASNSGTEMDDCGDLAEFGSVPLDLSSINFSFKNLSQLASINHDVLVQSAKHSPARG